MKHHLWMLGLCLTLAAPAAWAQPNDTRPPVAPRKTVAQRHDVTYQRTVRPIAPIVDSGVASDPYWQLDDMANVAACREFAQIANMKFGSFPPGRVWGVPFAYPGGGVAPPAR